MMRGVWFLRLLFSAHAEVFPTSLPTFAAFRALLRARGGISDFLRGFEEKAGSSPRTRRYFQVVGNFVDSVALFSAHAEVFPRIGSAPWLCLSLLRARGGISGSGNDPYATTLSSPRTRRYFQCR
ncbi:Uncharacterised protein [Corynebacterium striatum]|nr:Uncharacterised protein [Corynebacterium striatum]